MLLRRLALLVALLPTVAFAQRDTSREALSRLEESLTLQLERGGLSASSVLPAIVVSVTPAYEETRAWYPNAALGALIKVFGTSGLRACEACMAPRLDVRLPAVGGARARGARSGARLPPGTAPRRSWAP